MDSVLRYRRESCEFYFTLKPTERADGDFSVSILYTHVDYKNIPNVSWMRNERRDIGLDQGELKSIGTIWAFTVTLERLFYQSTFSYTSLLLEMEFQTITVIFTVTYGSWMTGIRRRVSVIIRWLRPVWTAGSIAILIINHRAFASLVAREIYKETS